MGAARAGVDEGLLRSVLSMLDIGPEEALVLDDSLPNVTASADLGMGAIHVTEPCRGHRRGTPLVPVGPVVSGGVGVPCCLGTGGGPR